MHIGHGGFSPLAPGGASVITLDGALRILVWGKESLCMAGGSELNIFRSLPTQDIQ